MEKLPATKNELQLIKGAHYLVKHDQSKRVVRRIFKGTEKRFDKILCYVFTGKVNKDASVRVDEGENGVYFWHWK